jgi:hypothetical protein
MHKPALMLPVAALLIASSPVRAASTCDAVVKAMLKVLQVPAHLYMTETAGFRGGKTRVLETIYFNNAMYVRVNGPWIKSPISNTELTEAKDKLDPKTSQCSVVRDEAVNGEPATLYQAHTQTPDDKVDTEVWISKSKGLPLKQISEIDVGGGASGKSHTEIRYEYTNVTAPAVTEPRRK